MKKLVLMLVLLLPVSVFAKNYGMAGCGLGSAVISENGFLQVFAATTNGTSGNQTFGITSGTSNCTADGVVVHDVEKIAFVESTKVQLKTEMAQGSGEFLAALGNLYQCDNSVLPIFNKTAQENINNIFTPDATATDSVKILNDIIKSNKELSSKCVVL